LWSAFSWFCVIWLVEILQSFLNRRVVPLRRRRVCVCFFCAQLPFAILQSWCLQVCTLCAVITLQIRRNTLAASLVPRPSLTIRMIAISWMDHTLPINFRTCLMDSSVNLYSVKNVTILKLTWYVTFARTSCCYFYTHYVAVLPAELHGPWAACIVI